MTRWGLFVLGLIACSAGSGGAGSGDDPASTGGSAGETGGASGVGGSGGGEPECVRVGESCGDGACCAGSLCVSDSTEPICAAICGTNDDCDSGCCVDVSGQQATRVCFDAAYCGTTGGTGGTSSGGGTSGTAGSGPRGGAGGTGPTCSTSTCEDLPCCSGMQCLEDGTCASECEEGSECASGCCSPVGATKVCAEAGYCNQCEANLCIPGSGCCCESQVCSRWSTDAFPVCVQERTCYVGCNCEQ